MTAVQHPVPENVPVSLSPISGASNLIAEIKAFINRFCFIRDENIYELLALWIICTHLYQDFEYVPYLFIHSPEKQSGKTRLLEVLDLLVASSSGILCAPTKAVLARTAFGFTQLLDEADGWQNMADIRSVLNAGFQRNGKVTRMDKDADGNYTKADFSVFAPRAIAGIGNSEILGDTLADRTYAIELVRQTASERREKLRGRQVAPEAAALKGRIQTWTNDNRQAVNQAYSGSFPYLDTFGDRTADISEPLAAILEVMYANDAGERDRAQRRFRAAIAATRFEGDDLADEHRVLSTILAHMGQEQQLKVQPSQVAKWCTDVPDLDEYRVGKILRQYGFENKSVRIPGGESRKGHVIDRPRLEEMVNRFVQNPSGATI